MNYSGQVPARKRRPDWLLAAAGIMVLIGVYLAIILPLQRMNAAKNAAQGAITELSEVVAEVERNLPELGWFKPAYGAGVLSNLEGAKANGMRAEELFSRAKSGSSRTRRELYTQARKGAAEALVPAKMARDNLSRALQSRDEAQKLAAALEQSLSASQATANRIRQRSEAELPRYPSRYAVSITRNSKRCASELEALQRLRYRQFLPPAVDRSGTADPDAAQAVLRPQLAVADSLSARAGRAISSLDEIKDLYEKAPALVAEGERKVENSSAELVLRKDRTGYWLKKPTGTLASGRERSRVARQMLTAVAAGEKVPDRPEAGREAQRVIALCEKAIADADAEISLAAAVIQRSRDFRGGVEDLSEASPMVEGSLRTARAHHGASAWSQYSSVAEHCGGAQISRYRSLLGKAERLASLEVQEFAEADRVLSTDLVEELDDRIDETERFIALVRQLEEDRSDYPAQYDRARRIIEDERDYVEQYGSHDSSALEDFEEAVRLLVAAEDSALDRLFSDAIDYAARAARYAEGTGSRCKRAYDDDQESARSSNDGGGGFFGGSSSGGDDDGSTSSSGSSDSDWGGSSDSGGDSDWGSGGSSGGDSDWGGGSDSGGGDSDW